MPSSFASSPCSRMLLPIRAPGNHRPPAYRTSTTIGFSVHLHSPTRAQSAGAPTAAASRSPGLPGRVARCSRRAVAAASAAAPGVPGAAPPRSAAEKLRCLVPRGAAASGRSGGWRCPRSGEDGIPDTVLGWSVYQSPLGKLEAVRSVSRGRDQSGWGRRRRTACTPPFRVRRTPAAV